MVYYLSTAHPPFDNLRTTVKRRQKDGTVAEFVCPPSVAAYADNMNGVDRLDQNTRQNKSKKTMKWYRRIETKLMETAIYNAYVLEGEVTDHKVQGQTKRDLLSFKMDLAHELIGNHFVAKQQTGRPRSEMTAADPSLDRTDHWPLRGEGENHTCVVCTARHNKYKETHPGVHYSENPFKKSKTTMMCEKCRVYLCSNQRDCFKVYHTRVTYV